ncbi:WbqC family protein [Xanthomarina gelatinilytica]|uniref:WbqC family protein n=1 Tax=Xanthomarina gelatinilytica TaxID=1137281 RepID=UPI003AA87823
MKTAIMQPYIFPYIGYFQLIHAVDEFVFLDNVNFIKRGWVNRNCILINDEKKMITFPCNKISQNKLIQNTEIDMTSKEYSKLIRTIKLAYRKAPYYNEVIPIIEKTLQSNFKTISELAIFSVKSVANYLQINTKFRISSIEFNEVKNAMPSDQLIQICKALNSKKYINAIGGQKLYEKEYFYKNSVDLYFLKPEINSYKQYNKEFVGGLSIIDVLMFNDVQTIQAMLKNYSLI